MAHVEITTTAMGFRVAVSKKGEILGSHLSIREYVRRFENMQYDQNLGYKVLVGEFFHFDRETDICYFPKYDLDEFCKFLKDRSAHYVVTALQPVEGVKADFHMLPHISYKSDKQKRAVEYLSSSASGPLRALALQTGEGKTVSFIWSLVNLGTRSLITMTSRLEQWVREFGKYTTLDESDIYVIAGVGSLTKLLSLIDNDIKPKVILASAKTIRLYLDYGPSYQHLPHPSLLCENLGIGIIGTDEYHEHFYTNFLIGIMLNPSIFIPITATFLASDPFVKGVFEKFVPKETQFVGGDYNKFVNVTAYQYTSGGYLIRPYNYTGRGVYSQQVFENFLLSNKGRKVLDPFVEDAVIPIIQEHYISIADKGEKLLLLCSSKKLCDHLAGVFKRAFKDKTVSVFYSGMPTTVLDRYDIILSTPGSAGTGRDIANLRTCLVLENVDSETRNLQFLGRLRGPPQMMNTPEFCYISFSSIPAHQRYHSKRSMLFGARARQFRHRSIS